MIAAPISRVLAFAVLFAIGTAATPALAQTSWTDATGSWFVLGKPLLKLMCARLGASSCTPISARKRGAVHAKTA